MCAPVHKYERQRDTERAHKNAQISVLYRKNQVKERYENGGCESSLGLP